MCALFFIPCPGIKNAQSLVNTVFRDYFFDYFFDYFYPEKHDKFLIFDGARRTKRRFGNCIESLLESAFFDT